MRFFRHLMLLAALLVPQVLCRAEKVSLRLDSSCVGCGMTRQNPVVPISEPAANLQAGLSANPCEFTAPGSSLSIFEVVERALCHNPEVKEAWAHVRAQRAAIGVERASLLPSLGVEAGYHSVREKVSLANGLSSEAVRTRGLSSEVGFSWLLFDFGRRAANLSKAREILASVEASRDAKLQTVLLQSAQLFYGALDAQALLDARDEALTAAQDNQRTAEARYRAGVGTKMDLLQARTAAAQAKVARTKAEGDFRTAAGALATAIGAKVNSAFILERPQFDRPDKEFKKSVDELLDAAQEKNPGLIAARAQLAAARLDLKAAKAEGLPSISFRANLVRDNQGSTFETSRPTSSRSVQLSISIPLYEGNLRSHRVKSSLALEEAKAADVKAREEQVALATWQAYQAVQVETENMKGADSLLVDARQAFEIARGRYRAGIGSMQDVLTAHVSLSEAQQQQIQSVTQWRVARLRLAASLGALVRGEVY